MDDRPNELFLLDAEQAVKEIAQYGLGQVELQTQRVTSTIDYLDTVLQSLGLERHAEFCGRFAKVFPLLDEGQGRRITRDFVVLAHAQFEAIRAGDELPKHDEALARLSARLPQLQRSETATTLPQTGRFFQDAARAIAAVDELAHRIQAGLERPAEHRAEPEVRTSAPDAHVTDPDAHASFLDAQDSEPRTHVSDLDDYASEPKDILIPFEQGVSKASLNAEGDHHEAVHDDFPLGIGASADTNLAIKEDPEPHLQRRLQVEVFSSAKIDQVFRRALKLTESGPWLTGVGALLEAVDDLDHLPLSLLQTPSFSLAAGASIRLQAELMASLADVFEQNRLTGMGDAILVAHTLILAIQLDAQVKLDSLAKLAGAHGGRLEVDASKLRLRLVIPASARLLRVVPFEVAGRWIAVPWAQLINADEEKGSNPLNLRQHERDLAERRLDVRLSIGDESDRISATEMGQTMVGVRFDIPRNLRRRERYRGLVLVPDGRLFPVYG